MVAERLGVDLTPVPQPSFTRPAPVASAGLLPHPAKATTSSTAPSGASSSEFSPRKPASNYQASIQDIIQKYNPDNKQLSRSPSPDKFFPANPGSRDLNNLLGSIGLGGSPPPAPPPVPPPAPKPAPKPPQLALTETCTGKEMSVLRERFREALAAIEFAWTKNNQTSTTRFTAQEVDLVCDMIFDRILNTAGMNRAKAIIVSHRKSLDSDNPLSANLAAANHARDVSLPQEIREFYFLYHVCTRKTAQPTAVDQMVALYEKYQLYHQYLLLANQPSREVQELLQTAGYTTKQGQGWVSVVQRYLAVRLGLEGKLSNVLQECQHAYLMVTTFGVGILVFVPKGIMSL